MSSRIRWFDDSPEEGDPLCLCSWCAERIEDIQDDEDDGYDESGQTGPCTRMWQKANGQTLEARFHDRCFNEAIDLGEVRFGASSEGRAVE